MANKYGASPDIKRETMKQAGRRYVTYLGQRRHLLYNPETVNASPLEIWTPNKHGAGYGLLYKNSALQFDRPAVRRLALG